MVEFVERAKVALLVGLLAGALFLLAQLAYALLVVMPGRITGGGALAVSVDFWWAVRFAALAGAAYLTWHIWPKNGERPRLH